MNIFIHKKRNPYETTAPMNFYHFASHQLVCPKTSAKILELFDKGLTEYVMFPVGRYLQKSKNPGEIIKLFNVPPFIPKKQI